MPDVEGSYHQIASDGLEPKNVTGRRLGAAVGISCLVLLSIAATTGLHRTSEGQATSLVGQLASGPIWQKVLRSEGTALSCAWNAKLGGMYRKSAPVWQAGGASLPSMVRCDHFLGKRIVNRGDTTITRANWWEPENADQQRENPAESKYMGDVGFKLDGVTSGVLIFAFIAFQFFVLAFVDFGNLLPPPEAR
eukprot:gnl/TRDRNA2_/TRDRNA2_67990_c0_seq1.p1 gnl/TRDRNA2_/TRDRNA2_67990_c0~~gnl/TRDRNA2_/TRDRNA2_67990_c0_seq1.p1  ORF type:complete len:193 (-),score=30.85 gnl/TRDRNA2_/TRDRNA2_67990_c0_seq1:172-750(-)